MSGVSNPFLALPTNRAAKPGVHRSGYGPNKGSLTQYVGRILRAHEHKTTAEVHDYLDEQTRVLAAMLAKRAPGYTGLGFPDPRKLTSTPSASPDSYRLGQPMTIH
jgi:hypothetical protein